MPRVVALFCMVTFFAVACTARQVRDETELQRAVRLAQAGDESGWRTLESTVRSDSADLYLRKTALSEIGKIQSPRGEPILKEYLQDRSLRGEAALGLVGQRGDNNKQEIDQLIVSSTEANLKAYNSLTKEEIRALGETDHPHSVRILREQLRRDPSKDGEVLDALGRILVRRKKALYNPMDFSHGIGQKATFETETIMSSGDKVNETATPEDAAADDPEKVLLEYLAGDGDSETKDRAVVGIQVAHPPGITYILNLIGSSKTPVKARLAIIDYLTRLAVNTQDKSMIKKLTVVRARAKNAQVVRSINLSLLVLNRAFGGRSTYYGSAAPKVTPPPVSVREEATLKQKPYIGTSAADVKTNLKRAFAYYHLDEQLLERMSSRVRALLNAPENKELAERNLIFVALGRLYPDRDYYVLKAQGQDAFSKPGYFTTTLQLVTASSRGRAWQVALLQRLWGLTANEADLLRQIYLRDGKILRQRMRL
ncbi:MAG: hypothetical protein LDLANPLL_00564 [Turneriella sp.]|nr:hypothetical protein [Turneriella sp.]